MKAAMSSPAMAPSRRCPRPDPSAWCGKNHFCVPYTPPTAHSYANSVAAVLLAFIFIGSAHLACAVSPVSFVSGNRSCAVYSLLYLVVHVPLTGYVCISRSVSPREVFYFYFYETQFCRGVMICRVNCFPLPVVGKGFGERFDCVKPVLSKEWECVLFSGVFFCADNAHVRQGVRIAASRRILYG